MYNKKKITRGQFFATYSYIKYICIFAGNFHLSVYFDNWADKFCKGNVRSWSQSKPDEVNVPRLIKRQVALRSAREVWQRCWSSGHAPPRARISSRATGKIAALEWPTSPLHLPPSRVLYGSPSSRAPASAARYAAQFICLPMSAHASLILI